MQERLVPGKIDKNLNIFKNRIFLMTFRLIVDILMYTFVQYRCEPMMFANCRGDLIMDKWRRIWREGLAPHLSRPGLLALQSALHNDDRRLLQGTTCYPPLLDMMRERAVVGTCALGFCGWQGDGLRRVGEIEEFFHDLCDAADAAFNEPAACRYFLNWYDDAPRAEMRRELLAEVTRSLQQPTAVAA
jgi:hypothetical protein